MSDAYKVYETMGKTSGGDIPVRYFKQVPWEDDIWILLKDGRIVFLSYLLPDRHKAEACYILYEDVNGCDSEEVVPLDAVEGIIIPTGSNG